MISKDLDLHTKLFDVCWCSSSVVVLGVQKETVPVFFTVSSSCFVFCNPLCLPLNYQCIWLLSLTLLILSLSHSSTGYHSSLSFLIFHFFLLPSLFVSRSLSFLIIPIPHSLSFSGVWTEFLSFSSSKSLTSIPGFWKILCSNGLCFFCLNQLRRCVK